MRENPRQQEHEPADLSLLRKGFEAFCALHTRLTAAFEDENRRRSALAERQRDLEDRIHCLESDTAIRRHLEAELAAVRTEIAKTQRRLVRTGNRVVAAGRIAENIQRQFD